MNQDIHTGIPFDTYAGWDLVNNSRLTDFARSPAYCKWKRDQPPIPPTDPMRFGSLCHLAVLEPVSFQANPVAPEVNRRTKVGREEWAHYLTLTSS